VPNFTACTNDNKRAAAKILHAILLNMQNNIININAALIDTLLSLTPMAFKLLYKQEQMMDPNAVFQQFLMEKLSDNSHFITLQIDGQTPNLFYSNYITNAKKVIRLHHQNKL
jgi:hypothetical protein